MHIVQLFSSVFILCGFFFQAEDGIRDLVRSRGLGDVYKRQCGIYVCRRDARAVRCPARAVRLPGELMIANPENQGLYDKQFEHDACGIGAVVDISGRPDHAILERGPAGRWYPPPPRPRKRRAPDSYTHLLAPETALELACRLLPATKRNRLQSKSHTH